MTLEAARLRIPKRDLPGFWVGDVRGLAARWDALQSGRARVLTVTPGGRPMYLVEFGRFESVRADANFNSAIGARDPNAYRERTARQQPVLLLVGPVHGQEVEGLTGLVNLIEIMESGKDLRGRDQSELQELGRQCRLLIIPAGNPDGTARFEPRSLNGMDVDDLRFWGQGTWADGTFCDWPGVKRLHPMRGAETGFIGCYFDDAGVNPMHDEFFAPLGPEAPAILRLSIDEAPDLAVSLHSHESPPAVLRPAYLPREGQEAARRLAVRLNDRLRKTGLPEGSVFDVEDEGGSIPGSFNLTSALYHASGAVSFTFECPHGLSNESSCRATMEQILDIQLSLYEEMMRSALEAKQR